MLKTKENKGITLVALVVTVIVLIILAAVTINLVVGQNGIITRAQQGTENYKQAEQDEQDMLEGIDSYIDIYIGGFNNKKGVNSPKLGSEMVAVYWDDEGNEIFQGDTEFKINDWYDYNNQKWANAVTKDGDGNITGYWVWIPRYAYKITNYNTSTAGTIDIKFLQGTSTTPGDGSNETIHSSRIF